MAKKILVTGATGLVGRRLTHLLLQKGHQVFHLGRKKENTGIPSFVWNVNTDELDPRALEGIDSIIHLAGAGVADKRWTASRKEEIMKSRTASTALLATNLAKSSHTVKKFISASAIGIYGFSDRHTVFTEDKPPADDFLATVVRNWEAEVDKISALDISVSKVRIGIVLSGEGGALVEMAKPIRWGFGAPLGSGDQCISWIHLDDLCELFCWLVENETLDGCYNATAAWNTNREITEAIASKLGKRLWLPPVPGFVLRILIGEMADILLGGSKVSSEKIKKTGFRFKYNKLDEALADLL